MAAVVLDHFRNELMIGCEDLAQVFRIKASRHGCRAYEIHEYHCYLTPLRGVMRQGRRRGRGLNGLGKARGWQRGSAVAAELLPDLNR
jgi:hypothetical protein